MTDRSGSSAPHVPLDQRFKEHERQLRNEAEAQPDRLRSSYCEGKADAFKYCANAVMVARAVLAASAEPQAVEEWGWQPVETIPAEMKDGRKFVTGKDYDSYGWQIGLSRFHNGGINEPPYLVQDGGGRPTHYLAGVPTTPGPVPLPEHGYYKGATGYTPAQEHQLEQANRIKALPRAICNDGSIARVFTPEPHEHLVRLSDVLAALRVGEPPVAAAPGSHREKWKCSCSMVVLTNGGPPTWNNSFGHVHEWELVSPLPAAETPKEPR